MNRKEWLLTQLASEAAEVIHATTKALQFGLDDKYNEEYKTARERLENELIDFEGTLRKVRADGIVPIGVLSQQRMVMIKEKMDKIERMYQYALEKGEVMP